MSEAIFLSGWTKGLIMSLGLLLQLACLLKQCKNPNHLKLLWQLCDGESLTRLSNLKLSGFKQNIVRKEGFEVPDQRAKPPSLHFCLIQARWGEKYERRVTGVGDL
jgi:hypothetical protein